MCSPSRLYRSDRQGAPVCVSIVSSVYVVLTGCIEVIGGAPVCISIVSSVCVVLAGCIEVIGKVLLCVSIVSSVYVVLTGCIEVIDVSQERNMAPMCKYEGPS